MTREEFDDPRFDDPRYVRDVKGYEGLYKVNAVGDVFSVKRNKVLAVTIDKFGYPKYCLYKDGKTRQVKAHRIVAEAFIPNPLNKREVNHIDGNKKNNAVWNLEWSTSSENTQHAVKTGLVKQSYPVRIVETGKEYNSVGECAKDIGGNVSDICRCLKGKVSKTHKGYHYERLV